MKKFVCCLLAAAALVLTSMPVFAAPANPAGDTESFTIVAGGQTLDLSGLPCALYQEGNTVMVPLRKIAEALGYQVGWDPETGAISVDDGYIQKAVLFDGTKAVRFEGKLQVIDMSREIENEAETSVLNGCAYVPLTFFQEFFNDTAIEETTITVAPGMCELHTQTAG